MKVTSGQTLGIMIKMAQPVCFKWMTETSMLLPKIEYTRNSSLLLLFFWVPYLYPCLCRPASMASGMAGLLQLPFPCSLRLRLAELTSKCLSSVHLWNAHATDTPVWGDISPFTKKSQEGTGISVLLCVRLVPLLNAGPVKWKSLSCVWLFATPWTIQSIELIL